MVEKIFQLTDIEGPLNKTDMNWEIYPEGLKKVIENEVNRYNLELFPFDCLICYENGMANNDLNIRILI